ncbi:MAG: alpha/beta hydrolase [Anaerolineae bacterium]|nr:alpha/beta hydrolase [Anaerolineae bacterium]
MNENEAILQRQKFNTRFKNQDMDFMFNWAVGITQIIGMSAAQVFYAIHDIKDGDPTQWREGFRQQGAYQRERASVLLAHKQPVVAGQFYLGAAYAYRAALHYTDPQAHDFVEQVGNMEKAFQEGVKLMGVPITPMEIPFEATTLSGYYLEHDAEPRPVVLMIGGGDTYREDLFYFAGYPGWKRGYNVLMVDLPGQGMMPARGQHFQVAMDYPIRVVLDWLEAHAAVKPQQIALYGVSGGGYFTAQAAADARIKAWIAATPIFDIATVFAREFGSALKTPGWLLNLTMRLVGSLNESAEINLAKYAWQFGTSDFKSAISGVFEQARVVDYAKITCPSLFLMSEGEGAELKRQTREVYDNFVQRGINVTLREFTAAEGADAHCQLNNLRLLHLVVFDWLDQLFAHESGDVRLYC